MRMGSRIAADPPHGVGGQAEPAVRINRFRLSCRTLPSEISSPTGRP
jgi:hypothetical protein